MPELSNSNVVSIFTIPASDWTVINKRVGLVLEIAPIQQTIITYIPSYPVLLQSSTLWEQITFTALITQSGLLAAYAATAITNFSSLNDAVKKISDPAAKVPADVQQQTATLLRQLSADTAPLVSAFNTISGQVLQFLNNNEVVDGQIAAHKGQLGTFWAPVGDVINALENAAGLVTGTWSAIRDDLANAIVLPVDVTMPFIESLNLDAAIKSWQTIQAEAIAFPVTVAGQQQYWQNPF
jgi:hypothetical protein